MPKNSFSIVSTALLHWAGMCFDIFRMSKNVRPRRLNVTEIENGWIGHVSPFVSYIKVWVSEKTKQKQKSKDYSRIWTWLCLAFLTLKIFAILALHYGEQNFFFPWVLKKDSYTWW